MKTFNKKLNFVVGPAFGITFLAMLVILTWGIAGNEPTNNANRTMSSISATK